MQPLVSIIIPTYNRAHLIGETLDSVLAQTYPKWECIIVDDGSTDTTDEVVGEYVKNDSRFQYHTRPVERLKGANACRNFGLDLLKGDYVIFLDSDDLLVNKCLENRIYKFFVYPEFDLLVFSMGHFVQSNNCYVDVNRSFVNLDKNKTIEEFLFGRKLPWNITRPIYRRKIFNENFGLNENMQNFQDDEFHIRLLGLKKVKFFSIDETDCYYRMDQKSLKKYSNLKGYQDIIDSLYYYYTSVFLVLSEEQKVVLKNKLTKKLFGQLKYYVLPNLNPTNILLIIKLFKKELNINLLNCCLLYCITCLNLYYYNKKGHYKVIRLIEKNLYRKSQ
jgi:glycosyltransferase involved in cell wall biosynthesis